MSILRKLRGKARILQAYRAVFLADETAGRTVLDDLIQMSGAGSLSSYMPGNDPATVAYREGRKSVVNHILACLHYDEGYVGRVNMLLDARDRQQLNQEIENNG